MEHADYLTMRAPRPTLTCAATRDFFDNQGTWASFREAKRVYGLLGFGERVDLFESDSGHGFPRSQREATLRFFSRWLLHRDEPLTEPEFAIANFPGLSKLCGDPRVSSSNLYPGPPMPVPCGSPPWIMKSGITR